jgi:hypothetical protein
MKRPLRPARSVAGFLGAATLLAFAAAPVMANHTHVMQIGNGQCVLLASESGEEDVVLPLAVFENNPNVMISPAPDRMHPLHVLVHRGVPGTHLLIAVANTAAAAALCEAGIVND